MKLSLLEVRVREGCLDLIVVEDGHKDFSYNREFFFAEFVIPT